MCLLTRLLVLQDCIEDATGAFRDFVCHLAIQYIEQKYKLALDSKYKLPKMTYKGDKVEDQYIQDRSQVPVIEEVSRPTKSAPAPATKAKAEAKHLSTVRELAFVLLAFVPLFLIIAMFLFTCCAEIAAAFVHLGSRKWRPRVDV